VLSEYICDFLELFAIFTAKGRKEAISALLMFVREKTFEDFDSKRLMNKMKQPVYKERLNEFLGLIKPLSAALEKEAETGSSYTV